MSTVSGKRIRSFAAWLVLLQGFALAFGCGGQSEKAGGGGDDDERGGSAGSSTGGSPSGGTAGDGGTNAGAASGTGGTSSGGSSGSAGTSSGGTSSGVGGTSSGGDTSGGASGDAGTPSGGSSGTAGMAGEGGTSSGAECETAMDCRMVSDCCSCRAVPISDPGFCGLDCIRDPCTEGGIGSDEVDCVMGRCVIARSCEGNVTCPALPPNCAEGMLPSVQDDCWGPCLEASECTSVPGCDACGDAVCVNFEGFGPAYHCVEPGAGCNAGSYCECLGACAVACNETAEGVSCFCPGC